jgi:hypothetical protein
LRFSFDGEIYKVVRITGPTHNFLGLAFMQAGVNGTVRVEPIVLKPGEPVRLRADEVRDKVMEGISEGNAELGTSYRASRIQFVPGDTGPVDIYRMLARRIVQRMHLRPGSYDGDAD